jgi:hypothetical protein
VDNLRTIVAMASALVQKATGDPGYAYPADVERITQVVHAIARDRWLDATGPTAHSALPELNAVAAHRLAEGAMGPARNRVGGDWYQNGHLPKPSQRTTLDEFGGRSAAGVRLAPTSVVVDFVTSRREKVAGIQAAYLSDPLWLMCPTAEGPEPPGIDPNGLRDLD